eukprot:4981624-Amphidinium_carterae.1
MLKEQNELLPCGPETRESEVPEQGGTRSLEQPKSKLLGGRTRKETLCRLLGVTSEGDYPWKDVL